MHAIIVSLVIAVNVWHAPFDGTVVVDPWITPPTLAYADVDNNKIALRSDWESWDKAYLCTVIVHEMGHLTGHKHSSDPANVMYRTIERYYWRCDKKFHPRSFKHRTVYVVPDSYEKRKR